MRKGRRRGMLWWSIGIVTAAALVVLLLWDGTNRPAATYTDVPAPVSAPVTLVQLSDLHAKQFAGDAVYRLTEAAAPDVIVFTGDLVNRSLVGDEEEACALLVRLTAVAPVVFIYGNHDIASEMDAFERERLEAGGVTVLENAETTLTVRGETLRFLGLQERDTPSADTAALLRRFEAQDGVRIVLSHYPELFANDARYRYRDYDVDLVLSGHAHGGQFIFPLIGSIYAPGQGLFPRYADGMRIENGTALVVNRGLGGESFPFRIGNRPEVGVVRLVPEA